MSTAATTVTWVILGAVVACLLAGAASDLMNRTVPNEIVVAVMLAGLALRLVLGGVWLSLLIWAAVLGLLGALAARNIAGWGDAKLIASVTILVPPAHVLSLLIDVAIAGGLLACVYLALWSVMRRSGFPPAEGDATATGFPAVLTRETARIGGRESMPYAVAIAGGAAYQIANEILRCWPATFCSA